MHAGLSYSRKDAIARHGGQAVAARIRFDRLSPPRQLFALLDSL